MSGAIISYFGTRALLQTVNSPWIKADIDGFALDPGLRISSMERVSKELMVGSSDYEGV